MEASVCRAQRFTTPPPTNGHSLPQCATADQAYLASHTTTTFTLSEVNQINYNFNQQPKSFESPNYQILDSGFNGITRMSSVEKYNPVDNLWIPVPDMYNQRSNFAVEVIDDMIFCIGGFNGNKRFN